MLRSGSKEVGDEIFNKIFHPIAVKLISHCDAVFRNGGASTGADEMVNVGRQENKIIFLNQSKISNVGKYNFCNNFNKRWLLFYISKLK